MVGTPDEMLPDRGPVAADQALRAARDLRVFDGRATAWLVVQRVLEVAGFAMFVGGVVFGSVLVGQWVWIGAGVGVVLFAWEGPVSRRAGAEPLRWPTRWRVGLVTAVVVAILASAALTEASQGSSGNGSSLVVGAAVLAACYLVAPVVRWLWSRRRPRGATAWPDGAQAYAVLTVLSRAQWVHPDRLAVLTGLPRDRCDEWLRACAARGLATTAARRAFLMRNAEITAGGRARLAGRRARRGQRGRSGAPSLPDRHADGRPSSPWRAPRAWLSRAPTPRHRPART